jgi:transcriptional regulator with XRE-family HTH domain
MAVSSPAFPMTQGALLSPRLTPTMLAAMRQEQLQEMGRKIVQLREAKGWNRTDLQVQTWHAARARGEDKGVSYRALERLENADFKGTDPNGPQARVLALIASALETTPQFLLGESPEERVKRYEEALESLDQRMAGIEQMLKQLVDQEAARLLAEAERAQAGRQAAKSSRGRKSPGRTSKQAA